MSFLCTGAKDSRFRNYMGITRDHYGLYITILALRSSACSEGKRAKILAAADKMKAA